MVLKRHFGEGGEGGSEFPNRFKRSNPFARCMNKDFVEELVSKLEPSLRSWVSQEVERGFNSYARSSHNLIDSRPGSSNCSSRILQLHFDGKLPAILFTGCRVFTEGSMMVRVVLRDATSGKIIKSGPESSAKVTLCVLEGDFNKDDRDDWSRQEFANRKVQQREGKRPLVTGNLVLILKEGVAYVEDVIFTDNSSWTRSGKFRLGATTSEGSIREGISNAFKVKDHRGESYKKLDRPSLTAEVWRLRKIAKDGASHKKLASRGIYNVRDFLRLYVTDQSSLRKILGSKISDKAWSTIIDHAMACLLDENDLYEYKAGDGTLLVLNCIYQVDGLILDGERYLPLDMLNLPQKLDVEKSKKIIYKNLNYLAPISDHSFVVRQMLLEGLQTSSYSNPSTGYVASQNVNFPVEQDQWGMQFNSGNAQVSPTNVYGVEEGNQFRVSVVRTSHQMEAVNPIMSNGLTSSNSYDEFPPDGYGWDTPTSLAPLSLTDQLVVNENFQVQTYPWQGNGFYVNSRNPAHGIVPSDIGIRISSSGSPKGRWCKIRAVIKWQMIKSCCKKYGKGFKHAF